MSRAYPELFVGRHAELEHVARMVDDPQHACHIWQIVGAGGVGKTWFLRELAQKYAEHPEVVVVTIDYNEPQNLSLATLSRRLLNHFAPFLANNDVQTFLTMMARVEDASEIDMDVSHIEQEEKAAYQFGLSLINTVSQHKRILILSDSLDASRPDIQKGIDQLIIQFHNTVLVLAARPLPDVYTIYSLQHDIYADWVHYPTHKMREFSELEVKQYLEGFLSSESAPELSTTTTSPVHIDENLVQKIICLTTGNPVKVSIVGEWLRSNISLPGDIDFTVHDFNLLSPQEQQRIRDRFDFELLNGIRSLDDPISWAILYLSYLNRRFDANILGMLLERSEEEMQTILINLSHLVFIRKSTSRNIGMLHDEVQVLINRHVWPFVDPDNSIRRGIARVVVEQYYNPRIQQLREQLSRFWKLEPIKQEGRYSILPDVVRDEDMSIYLQLERIDYAFRYAEEAGWSFIHQVFQEATLLRITLIIQVIQSWMPAIAMHPRFLVELADVYSSRGEYERAKEYVDAVITAPAQDKEAEIRALCVQAECESDVRKKNDQYEQAIAQARSLNKNALLASILNSLGQANRKNGEWERAEHYYRETLRLQQPGSSDYAATLNNLAFACMLNGSIAEADNFADESLFMRQRLADQRGIGFSNLTIGRIAAAQGDYGEAIRRFHMAAEIFKRFDDESNYALALINIAETESYAHNFEPVYELLNHIVDARKPDVRVRAMLQMGKAQSAEAREQRRRGATAEEVSTKFDQAERYYGDALVLSRRFRLDDLTATSLFQLALLSFFRHSAEDHQHIGELRALLADHNYTLEHGRLCELEGDILFHQGQLYPALAKYSEACRILGPYNDVNFKQTFARVRTKLREHPELKPHFCRLALEQLMPVLRGFPLAQLTVFCQRTSDAE